MALFQCAAAERICITPGPLYSPGGHFRNALRLSCCYPLDERTIAALVRLGELAKSLA